MFHMVIFVMHHPDECGSILDAWGATGITGITILESSGVGNLPRRASRDDLPLMPSLHDLLKGKETRHRTLFSVVEGEEKVDQLIEATEAVVGSLNQNKTGVLFVLPVSRVYGMETPSEDTD